MAAAERQRTAQQLPTKTPALLPTSYGGKVDLAGPERTGGSASGARHSSLYGLGGGLSGGGGGLSGGGGAGPFGTSSSGSHGRGGGLAGGGGAGLRDLGDEGARLTLAESSARQPVASTSGSTADQPHPYQEFFTQAAVGTQEKLRVLSEHYFKHHSEKEASIVTIKAPGQNRRMLISRQEQYQGLQDTLAAVVKTRASPDLVASLRRLLTVEELDVNHLKDQELLLEGMLQL